MIASGHFVTVGVSRGCLVVKDGDRTRRIERVPKTEERIVIAGNVGYISLEAMAWLEQCGIPWSVLWRDQVVAGSASGTGDLRLWRKQILAPPEPITRYLLLVKLTGQAAVATEMGAPETARRIRDLTQAMADVDNLDALLGIEAKAAATYWRAWHRVTVPFIADHMLKVPPRWTRFVDRDSLATKGQRNATDPVNALLNYAYKVGETLCVEGIQETGMSPLIGISHHSPKQRNSMALDLLEAIRPECDRVILRMLGEPPWLRWHDFLELDSGVVRIETGSIRERVIREVSWLRDAVGGYAREVAEAVDVIVP